jgi:hypothetical protein
LKKQNGENKNYVLDSTAFLALFEDEPGAETVQKLLERAKKGEIVIFTSFVSFTEIFYITLCSPLPIHGSQLLQYFMMPSWYIKTLNLSN